MTAPTVTDYKAAITSALNDATTTANIDRLWNQFTGLGYSLRRWYLKTYRAAVVDLMARKRTAVNVTLSGNLNVSQQQEITNLQALLAQIDAELATPDSVASASGPAIVVDNTHTYEVR